MAASTMVELGKVSDVASCCAVSDWLIGKPADCGRCSWVGYIIFACCIAGNARVNDLYDALGDKAEDIGVCLSGHTIGIVGRSRLVNSYRVGYPYISRGDDGDFAFDDLIGVGKGSVAVASDYDVAVDVDLSARVACIAAEGLGDIGVCQLGR